MTKSDIVKAVLRVSGDMDKQRACELMEETLEIIKQTLSAGETIKIAGFGVFSVRDKRSRVGRNPQTGDKIVLAARRVVIFRPSRVLRDIVNENAH